MNGVLVDNAKRLVLLLVAATLFGCQTRQSRLLAPRRQVNLSKPRPPSDVGPLARKSWPKTPAIYEYSAVPTLPRLVLNYFPLTGSEDGKLGWTWEDYLAIAYEPLEFAVWGAALPVTVWAIPPTLRADRGDQLNRKYGFRAIMGDLPPYRQRPW